MADPVATAAVRALRRAAAELGRLAVDDGGEPAEPGGTPPAGRFPASWTPAEALARARRAAGLGAFVALHDEAATAAPPAGPLRGVPVAVKDNIDVAGQRVANGTTGAAARTAEADAEVWRRAAAAGAVLVGRTRMHELAWGVTTPGTRNPHDAARGAGGSSGGSAVAVAAQVVPLALGTDTGGSIRIPAALCGVAGLRPTAGAVPLAGVSPLAPSLDTAGPIARTAAECLLAHLVLSSRPEPPAEEVAGLRVGLLVRECTERVSPGVRTATLAAADRLRAAGVRVVEVHLPRAGLARAAGYVVMLVEAAARWATPDLLADGALTGETAALLRAGTEVAGTDYLLARRVGALLRRDVDALLRAEELAALLLPTVPVTAAPAAAATVDVAGRAEGVGAVYTRLTMLASVTGHPALSVPVGTDGGGLPVGAQLVGARHDEARICRLGAVVERSCPAPPVEGTTGAVRRGGRRPR